MIGWLFALINNMLHKFLQKIVEETEVETGSTYCAKKMKT